jgi:hypothetical protein
MKSRVTTFSFLLLFANAMSLGAQSLGAQSLGAQASCLLLMSTASSAQTEVRSSAWQATVSLDSAALYAGVSASSRVVTQLNRGDAVVINMEITGADGKWYSVTTAGESPTSGYLSGRVLDVQEPVAVIGWEYQPPPEVVAAPGPSAAEEAKDIVAASRGKVVGDIKSFFVSKFGRTLPVSAFGQTRLHSRLGFDHRNGVDVALSPDSAEGRALIGATQAGLPFITVR